MEDLAIKRIFQENAGPGLRALVVLLISVVFLILDQRSVFFNAERLRVSSVVAYPFQWTVDAPIRFFNWLTLGITMQHDLIHENDELRVQQILLQARLQKLLTLEKENAELRQLLKSTSEVSGQVSIARLLTASLNPNLQEVILNKGEKDRVFVGQPVFDAHGVMGQVVGVGALTSRVLLITDPQSAVPVEDYRNGMRAIAVGMGSSGQLTLINVPDVNDVQPGDLFVTSGLGLHYPSGYPVGMVSKIQRADANLSAKILLSPMAHITQTTQVLLLWPDEKELSKAVQKELEATAQATAKATTP